MRLRNFRIPSAIAGLALLAGSVAAQSVPPSPTPTPVVLCNGNRLLANQSLTLGQCLISTNHYEFKLQTDGNLVLYNRSLQPVWAAGTNGKPVNRCTMQSDGNLVIYSTSNKAIWASHTDGHPNSYLIVQDDGNVVIYQNVGGINRPIWSTSTVGQ